MIFILKNVPSESCDEFRPIAKNEKGSILQRKNEVNKRPRFALNEQVWMRDSSGGRSKEAGFKK